MMVTLKLVVGVVLLYMTNYMLNQSILLIHSLWYTQRIQQMNFCSNIHLQLNNLREYRDDNPNCLSS